MNTGGQCTAKNFIGLKPRMFSPANLSVSTVCQMKLYYSAKQTEHLPSLL